MGDGGGEREAFSQTSRRDSTETNKFSKGGRGWVSRLRNGTRHQLFMNVVVTSSLGNGSRIPISYGGAMKYAKVLYERAFDTSQRLKIYGDTVERERERKFQTVDIAYLGPSCCSAVVAKIITTVEGVLCKGDAARHIVPNKFRRGGFHVGKSIDVARNETT